MRFSISTNWNSHRHESGSDMLSELLELGFDTVELGYALTHAQSEDVRRYVANGKIKVSSVHAYSPNPLPGSNAGPEPFSICDTRDFLHGRRAIKGVLDTARFAAEVGAKKIVLHAGRAAKGFLGLTKGGGPAAARRLNYMVEAGLRHSVQYEHYLGRYIEKREKAVEKPLQVLHKSLDILLPELEELGVVLCLENLPTADAIPNEPEMVALLREFAGAPLKYWHDIGHGQIRHELGLLHHASFVKRMAPHIGGFHLHDVVPPIEDHHEPQGALVDFSIIKPFIQSDIPLVLEPSHSKVSPDQLIQGLNYLQKL